MERERSQVKLFHSISEIQSNGMRRMANFFHNFILFLMAHTQIRKIMQGCATKANITVFTRGDNSGQFMICFVYFIKDSFNFGP